jgi:hypothetical protein
MISQNYSTYAGKLFFELAWELLYFPLWWYSKGLIKLIVSLRNFLVDKQKKLALVVWMKNIFRPMYGQYDWQGMIISFFMRLVQIIFRGLLMLSLSVLAIVVILVWLVLPIFTVYEIIFQLFL